MYLMIGYKGDEWHIEPFFNGAQRKLIVEQWLTAGITTFGELEHIEGELWQLRSTVGKQLLQGFVTPTAAG